MYVLVLSPDPPIPQRWMRAGDVIHPALRYRGSGDETNVCTWRADDRCLIRHCTQLVNKFCNLLAAKASHVMKFT